MMNNERRKALKALRLQVEAVHAALSAFDLDTMKDDLENLLADEQEAYDNMPESLQESDRGQTSQAAIDQMEGAQGDFETLVEMMQALENIAGCLETAAE